MAEWPVQPAGHWWVIEQYDFILMTFRTL